MPAPGSSALPPVVEWSASPVASTDARLVAVGFSRSGEEYTLGAAAEQALNELGIDAFALLDRTKPEGKAGDTVVQEVFGSSAVEQVLLVGLGAERAADYRRAGSVVARAARTRGPAATSLAALADDDQLDALCEGLVLGAFGFSRTSGETKAPHAPVVVLTDVAGRATSAEASDGARPDGEQVVRRAVRRASASWQARTFALTPSNEKGPERLEQWAREAASAGGLDVTVWDDEALERDGFGGIVAVGSASAYPSRFVRLDYRPARAGRRTRHVVIVGKGITFDTGGLSIKPRDAMTTMKRDMTGAGVVIAVMAVLRDLDVPVRVTGLVAAAENAFGAAAMRPSDVITHYGGRTSEVGNTDAEGRLVLADALAYADAELDPDVVVDIATLTGAGRVALGTSLGALFANDDRLAEQLLAAGRAAGEPVWRLPLHEEYEPLIESAFADANNAGGSPGAITAALFLQHFAGDVPWAHLDIASVGDSATDAFEYTAGATGFGARLLLRWLADSAAAG